MKFLGLVTLLGVATLATAEETTKPTKFNGVEVPPLLELTPDTYEKEIKAHKFLMVKHYR